MLLLIAAPTIVSLPDNELPLNFHSGLALALAAAIALNMSAATETSNRMLFLDFIIRFLIYPSGSWL